MSSKHTPHSYDAQFARLSSYITSYLYVANLGLLCPIWSEDRQVAKIKHLKNEILDASFFLAKSANEIEQVSKAIATLKHQRHQWSMMIVDLSLNPGQFGFDNERAGALARIDLAKKRLDKLIEQLASYIED